MRLKKLPVTVCFMQNTQMSFGPGSYDSSFDPSMLINQPYPFFLKFL
jgi:hypothetical protein